jgi:hypothetical protein
VRTSKIKGGDIHMTYSRELGLAIIAFGLLTLLGFALMNPHGQGNIVTHWIGYVLLLPIFSLLQVADAYPTAVNFTVLGFAQFVWSSLLMFLLRMGYPRLARLWRKPQEPKE